MHLSLSRGGIDRGPETASAPAASDSWFDLARVDVSPSRGGIDGGSDIVPAAAATARAVGRQPLAILYWSDLAQKNLNVNSYEVEV